MKKQLIAIGLIVLLAITLLTSCMSSSMDCGDSMWKLLKNEEKRNESLKITNEAQFAQLEKDEQLQKN